jgi:hypothetical protein
METFQEPAGSEPAPDRAGPVAPALAGAGAAGGPGRKAENVYTLIYGAKGMGKTTLARAMYLRQLRAGRSGVVVDPTGSNGDLGTVVTSTGQWWDHVRAELGAGRQFSTVVQMSWGESHNDLWRLIYVVAKQTGGLLLLLDEAEQFANAHRIDANLAELVSLGRNARIDIITTVRTPPELHGLLRGNRDQVVTFRQPAQPYADKLNGDFFHLPNGADRIRTLPRFSYLLAREGEVSAGRVDLDQLAG